MLSASFYCFKNELYWVWQHTPITPALEKLRPVDCYEHEASMGFIASFRQAWSISKVLSQKTKKRISFMFMLNWQF